MSKTDLIAEARLGQWKDEIIKINGGSTKFPHSNNLFTKLSLPKANTPEWIKAFAQVVPAYIKLRSSKIKRDGEKKDYSQLVINVNTYLKLLQTPQCDIFARQSDFKSSLIPELMYVLFEDIVKMLDVPCTVSAQGSVIVDCQFDAMDNGRIFFKKKCVDVGIFLKADLSFREEVQKDFSIPLVVVEVKTNLDKNMISGIEHSAESLKRTFPRCLYIVITEYADFAVESQNYATTAIDEMYVLRKQKRSEIRTRKSKGIKLQGNTPNDINLELVNELGELIQSHLKGAFKPIPSIKKRMVKGLLLKMD